MKTFKEYGGDLVDPHYHAYGGSLLGPSLGQYRPVADLNANRHNNSKKQSQEPRRIITKKIGRNEPCPCGSEKKFKQCHGK